MLLLSTKVKGYPFQVLTEVDGQTGVVLADQVKSLDGRVRPAKRKGAVTNAVMEEVRARGNALLRMR